MHSVSKVHLLSHVTQFYRPSYSIDTVPVTGITASPLHCAVQHTIKHTHIKKGAAPAFWLPLTEPTKTLQGRRNFKESAREERKKEKVEEKEGLIKSLWVLEPILTYSSSLSLFNFFFLQVVILMELRFRCFSAFSFLFFSFLRALSFPSFIAFLSFCAKNPFLWNCHLQMW